MLAFWILFAIIGFAITLLLGYALLVKYYEVIGILLIISAIIILLFGSFMAYNEIIHENPQDTEPIIETDYNYCPNCGYELPKGGLTND